MTLRVGMGRGFACAVALLSLVLLLVACAPPAPPPGEPVVAVAPPSLDEAFYRQAAARGAAVYAIDANRSRAWLKVRRGGPLAGMGHDHVIAARGVRGFVLLPDAGRAGRADLAIDLRQLEVDDPELRRQAGVGEPLSGRAIAGTRRNMHAKVLETERYPWLQVAAHSPAKTGLPRQLTVTFTLHGVSREFSVPVRFEMQDATLAIKGRLTLSQRAFGITSFSVLGGALRVEDALPMQFHLQARRLVASDAVPIE
jgi:polyisoprenoid-binding protein YceI